MSSQGKAPWELYATTMLNHFGSPIWHAGPEIDEQFGPREVELGSVGFLERGEFRHIFNARKAHDDPFNLNRVPDTFDMFNPPHLTTTAPHPVLRQSYLASTSVGKLEMDGKRWRGISPVVYGTGS